MFFVFVILFNNGHVLHLRPETVSVDGWGMVLDDYDSQMVSRDNCLNFLTFVLQLRKNSRKNLNQETHPTGIWTGPLDERQWHYSWPQCWRSNENEQNTRMWPIHSKRQDFEYTIHHVFTRKTNQNLQFELWLQATIFLFPFFVRNSANWNRLHTSLNKKFEFKLWKVDVW